MSSTPPPSILVSRIGQSYYALPLVADQQNNLKGLIQEIGLDERDMESPRKAIEQLTSEQVRMPRNATASATLRFGSSRDYELVLEETGASLHHRMVCSIQDVCCIFRDSSSIFTSSCLGNQCKD